MKQQHQTFIIEMIKHGDKTMAYQKAYPKCTDAESARKSAERLLRHHPDIAAEIEEATAHIRHQAYTDAYRLHTEQQKTKLLSIMDKREILARIAKCEIKVCRYIKDGDRYRMLFEDPHPREIMKAIEADGRIEDRCNRARNLADPKLSQFNVYIDGRPCDYPTAPINPDLPPGLVMLPRTRKKLITEQGNKTEQNSKVPLPGGAGVGLLAMEEISIEEQGNNLEQNNLQHLSPEFIPPTAGGESEGLTQQYLALYRKRKLRVEDLMCASFYSRNKAAEAAAPPPHILTDEEVRQFHADADRQLKEKKKQAQQPYNTFGKMYFSPEGQIKQGVK